MVPTQAEPKAVQETTAVLYVTTLQLVLPDLPVGDSQYTQTCPFVSSSVEELQNGSSGPRQGLQSPEHWLFSTRSSEAEKPAQPPPEGFERQRRRVFLL